MQYIVMDMEWNQPWPGSPSAKKPLPHPMRGEIVQIGAVRVREDQTVADEFQILIRPTFFKRMNRKVASLTGIRDAVLRENGVEFKEAMQQFRAWCGGDAVFLTWGFDDIPMLKENLAIWQMEDDWCSRWYNAQLLFNAEMGGGTGQKALSTALEMMDIEPSRPAHDALGDAYHTALICARLHLAEGVDAYDQALKAHEDGFHGAEMPGCISRSVHHGYADKTAALGAMSAGENKCPVCGEIMSCGRWLPQPGKRYMTRSECPVHGNYYVRLRLVSEEEGLRVNRLVYESDSEAAEKYRELLQKPRPHRRRRRRPHAKPASQEKES